MKIDHLFIFSETHGQEAEDLIQFGLTEGSSRRHPGQGTINRKFYFENFFLEILWVIDRDEIQASPTRETHLWQRANFRQNGSSRFGLCLVNDETTDSLFSHCQHYQPRYFPEGMSIDILPNATEPQFPWTFRLPYRGKPKAHSEPTQHRNGMTQLTRAEFGLRSLPSRSTYLNNFTSQNSIVFKKAKALTLTLEFDHGRQQKSLDLEALQLKLNY